MIVTTEDGNFLCQILLKDFVLTNEGLGNMCLLHHCTEQWPYLEALAAHCFCSTCTKASTTVRNNTNNLTFFFWNATIISLTHSLLLDKFHVGPTNNGSNINFYPIWTWNRNILNWYMNLNHNRLASCNEIIRLCQKARAGGVK